MRWCLSPIIGDGTQSIVVGQETTTGPFRAKASDYGGHVAIIPSNPDGTPAFNWCLVRLANTSVAEAEADTSLTVFPNLQLGDVLTANQRNWLVTRLNNHGLPSGWVDPGITVRQVLRTIGRYLEADFDVDWMTLHE